MSGLEAIGAIASVSQIVQYTSTLIIRLHELYRNVEHAGERYTRYKDQIDQLLQIADVINSVDELFQSEIVASHVHALVKTTESIGDALRQGYVGDISKRWKKCLKAWQWNKAEDAILRGFADLERDKSCLTLCVLGTYGSLISRIDKNLESGIPSLQGQVGNIERALSSCAGLAEEGRRIRINPGSLYQTYCSIRKCRKMHKGSGDNQELVIIGAQAIQEKPRSSNSCPQTPSSNGCSENLDDSCVLVKRPNDGDGDSDSGYATISDCTTAHEPPQPKRSWSDNMAFGKAVQVNGSIGRREDMAEEPLTHCQWNKNEARDQSSQVNGEVLDVNFAAMFFSRRSTCP